MVFGLSWSFAVEDLLLLIGSTAAGFVSHSRCLVDFYSILRKGFKMSIGFKKEQLSFLRILFTLSHHSAAPMPMPIAHDKSFQRMVGWSDQNQQIREYFIDEESAEQLKIILIVLKQIMSLYSHTPSKSKVRQSRSRLTYSRQANNQQHSRSVSKAKSSRTCRDSKLIQELDLIESKLMKNRAKLTTCLQIYSMLQVGEQRQRCLLHNNTLSLYCLNERRVLCVNCIYGVHKHRTHKVLPLKDCIPEIQADNRDLKIIIDNELRRLETYSKTAGDNKLLLEAELGKAIKALQKNYSEKVEELERNYESSKRQIGETYEILIQKFDSTQKMFDDFKFRIWEGVTKFGDRTFNDEGDVVKQIFYVGIADLCEVKNRKITAREIEGLARKCRIAL